MVVEDILVSGEHFEVMQPIVLTSRIFGLFPIGFSKYGTQYKIKWSIGYSVYSYLLTIGLSVMTLIGVISDLQKDDDHSIRMKDKKTRYVTCCDISIVIVIIVFSTVTLPFKIRKFWTLLHCLNQVDTIIPITQPKKYRNSSIYFIACILFIFFLIITFDIILWERSARKSENSAIFFRQYLGFYLLYCLMVMQEILFWHIIFFIKIRISMLNKRLQGLENRRDVFNKIFIEPYVKKKNTLSSQSIVAVASVNQNYDPSDVNHRTDEVKTVDMVTAYTKVQEKIFEAVESVNSGVAYGVHLIMLSCLLHLIVTPYFLLTEIMKRDGNILFISLQSVWLIGHIGRVLIIVEPCQLCLDEHQKTSNIICEMLTRDFDEGVKKALTIFSLQLSYCKIKFSSCGFFKINRSLLTSIAGAVTTYLVILFQFNN